MTALEALHHLRDRVAPIQAAESRHKPHWTHKDMEAVERLLERPAAAEQIALARIEGISSVTSYVNEGARLQQINAIAKRGLNIGAPAVQKLKAAPERPKENVA